MTMATTPDGAPLTPTTPCTVCQATQRWDDAGVWRCQACWPKPLTRAARQAEADEKRRDGRGRPPAESRRVAPAGATPARPPADTGAAGVGKGPSYCKKCAQTSTWLLREGLEVCYKCFAQKPLRKDV
jgi:hypothetical protein